MIKDILVHLDGDGVDAAAVAAAAGIAKRFSARLTGLFGRVERHAPSLVARRPSEMLLAAAARARDTFAAETSGLDTRWWEILHGDAREMVGETVFCAHYADLVVVGRPGSGHVPDTMVEEVIRECGRPVLVVPPEWTGEVGRRPVIAWLSGKEAARALHDALPLMAGGEAVVVASVGRHDAIPDGQPKVDVVDHLRRHGLVVTGERIHTDGLGVMDTLLSRAYDLDADLLVMGAHGGGSLLSRGGAGMRHVLAHMNLPVLFSQG